MSEYQIKLEAIAEYQDALRYKQVNEELCNSLLALVGQLSRHYKKAGLEMPEELSKIMERASQALETRIESAKMAHPVCQTA